LEALSARMRPDTLARETRRERERLARVSRQFADAARRLEGGRRARLEALDRLRETLGYKETLKRGYAVVRGDGALVTGTEAAQAARELELEFADGKVTVGGGGKPKKPAPKAPPEQGTLL
jgi:exodeoxyribonuclease VII large subunit